MSTGAVTESTCRAGETSKSALRTSGVAGEQSGAVGPRPSHTHQSGMSCVSLFISPGEFTKTKTHGTRRCAKRDAAAPRGDADHGGYVGDGVAHRGHFEELRVLAHELHTKVRSRLSNRFEHRANLDTRDFFSLTRLSLACAARKPPWEPPHTPTRCASRRSGRAAIALSVARTQSVTSCEPHRPGKLQQKRVMMNVSKEERIHTACVSQPLLSWCALSLSHEG